MLTRSALLLLTLPLLASCSASRIAHQVQQEYVKPEPVEFEKTITLDIESFDRTWESIIGFFATRQIPIETIEKDSGIIVAKKIAANEEESGLIARLGEIRTTTWMVRQSMSPSRFQGSMNYWVVRSTGKVTESDVIEGSREESSEMASYRVTLSFNVFVERFGTDQVRTTINTIVTPGRKLLVTSGWVWDNKAPTDRTLSPPEILGRLGRHGVQPKAIVPVPVSSGSLETQFLEHVRERHAKASG